MTDIDDLSVQLLEQAKRFLERAKSEPDQDGQSAYCNAALLLGFCALEAHLNAVAEELTLRKGLGVLDQSILSERDFSLDAGRFVVTKKLKIYRLEDRLSHIFATFTSSNVLSAHSWWGNLKVGLELRNRLVHAKSGLRIDEGAVARSLRAILDCLDDLYRGVYRRRYPAHNRGLDSTLRF